MSVRAAAATIDPRVVRAWAALGAVDDPEIPTVSIVDLGVVRSVRATETSVEVAITPTYSGCPATAAIALAARAALDAAGLPDARIETVLSPAWTTDWITPKGRARLRDAGIAPPDPRERAPCPRCGSTSTEKISEFGSTACKAHWRCTTCREPFDRFKCI